MIRERIEWDERVLGALEHDTYTGADLIARNTYFGTPHEHNPRFFAEDVDDQYRNRSATCHRRL